MGNNSSSPAEAEAKAEAKAKEQAQVREARARAEAKKRFGNGLSVAGHGSLVSSARYSSNRNSSTDTEELKKVEAEAEAKRIADKASRPTLVTRNGVITLGRSLEYQNNKPEEVSSTAYSLNSNK